MDTPAGRRITGLQESEFSRPGNGLRPAAHLQLAVNAMDVFFNGTDSQNQVLGNFLIGITSPYPP